jgi:uncharacterized paraquat-inducible protein A
MKTTTVIVHADRGDGPAKPAELVLCSDCGGDAFQILVIDGHQHVQCTSCGTSYCDGKCDAPGVPSLIERRFTTTAPPDPSP